MIVAFHRAMLDELHQERHNIEQAILHGAKDWNEYHMMIGKRQGIVTALSVLDEVIKRFDAEQ